MKTKKLLALVCVLALLMSAVGCSQSSGKTAATTAAAATTAPAATTAGPAATAAATTAAKQPIVIKFACTQNEKDLMAVNMKKMIDEITAKTNGGIKCEFYPNGQLGKLNDILEMQKQGANIVCSNGMEAMTDYIKDIGAIAGPYLFKNTDEVAKLVSSDWMMEIQKACRDYGIMGLSYNWITGFRDMIGKKKIEKPADMAGVQIRGANTTLFGLVLKSLKATHLTSNWNEVYTGLSTGVYDLTEADVPLLYSSNLYEVSKYLSLTDHHVNVCGMWISSKFFDTIPADYQKIMQDASFAAGVSFSSDNKTKRDESIEAFKAKKVEVVTADHDAFVEATKGVWDQYPQFSKGIYDKLRAIVEK